MLKHKISERGIRIAHNGVSGSNFYTPFMNNPACKPTVFTVNLGFYFPTAQLKVDILDIVWNITQN